MNQQGCYICNRKPSVHIQIEATANQYHRKFKASWTSRPCCHPLANHPFWAASLLRRNWESQIWNCTSEAPEVRVKKQQQKKHPEFGCETWVFREQPFFANVYTSVGVVSRNKPCLLASFPGFTVRSYSDQSEMQRLIGLSTSARYSLGTRLHACVHGLGDILH